MKLGLLQLREVGLYGITSNNLQRGEVTGIHGYSLGSLMINMRDRYRDQC